LQEAGGGQNLLKVWRRISAKGSSDLALDLEDPGSDDLLEIVQHENAALAVFDIFYVLWHQFNLDKRRTMTRTATSFSL
jgi:hypothetical protein